MVFITSMVFGVGFASSVFGYSIEQLVNVPATNDFTMGPGKIEVFAEQGEEVVKFLQITNRFGKEMKFTVGVEDFRGSPTGEEAAVLLGSENGPYSLKEFIRPELSEFTLAHGERIVLPVKIFIPSENAEPGGLYGAVLISNSPSEVSAAETSGGEIKAIGRIGALFFVKVKGDAREEGNLEKFTTQDSKKIYQEGPISFRVLYKNAGNVHLNPYGFIELKNILGQKIGEIEIDPYFAMPQSLRARELSWDRKFGLGYYTATISLNRGYQNIVDRARISFWIFPWKIILIALAAIFLSAVIVWWFLTHFEFRRKSKDGGDNI